MKIGDIAKKYNLSKDTLHYYVSIGLLLPRRRGNLLEFGQKDIADLELIQKYKAMNFSLKEIHRLISVRRLSNAHAPEFIYNSITMLHEKSNEIKMQMQTLKETMGSIDDEITHLSGLVAYTGATTGVPLSAVGLLQCPHCHSGLNIENAQIACQYILEGNIYCGCGYHILIKDGIVVTGNRSDTIYDQPDLGREVYSGLSDEMADLYQAVYNKMTETIKGSSLSGKTILETNINGSFFLYSHFRDFHENSLYIIVDKYEETLAMYTMST